MKSFLGQFNIAAAGNVMATFELNKHLLRRINFELVVNITNPAGGSTIVEDALMRLLTQVRVFAGDTPDFAMSGRELRHFFDLVNRAPIVYTEILGTASSTTTQTVRFAITFADFSNPVFPDSTDLDCRLATRPRIEVDIGGIGAITATAGATLDASTLSAWAEYYTLPADLVKARGTTIRRIKSRTNFNLATSATPFLVVELDRGEIVRRIMFMSVNNAAPRARSDARITNMELVVNGQPEGMMSWQALRNSTRQEFHTGVGVAAGTPVADGLPTGVVIMNFDPAESLDPEMMLDLRGVNLFEVHALTDATASDLITVQESIILPTKQDLEALGIRTS